MTINPRLVGQECLRCGAHFGLEDLFEGCPICSKVGHAASVILTYRDEGDQAPFPILGGPTLGEGKTPLIDLPWIAEALGCGAVHLKAEYLNPMGSHKDRMSQQVVPWARLRGAKRVVAASSGNAGVSVSAYAALSAMPCTILVKEGIGEPWLTAMKGYGADIEVLPDSHARWARQRELVAEGDVYPVTNHMLPPVGSNPIGVQGYKAVGHELFEQTQGSVDAILVPTARGDLLWGIWEGFKDMAPPQSPLPRMVAVEPFPRLSLILQGEDYRRTFPGSSRQSSIAGDTATWQSLHTLRASGGLAVEVGDEAALKASKALLSRGIALELCAAATVPALRVLCGEEAIPPGSRVVLLGTSDGRYEAGRSQG